MGQLDISPPKSTLPPPRRGARGPDRRAQIYARQVVSGCGSSIWLFPMTNFALEHNQKPLAHPNRPLRQPFRAFARFILPAHRPRWSRAFRDVATRPTVGMTPFLDRDGIPVPVLDRRGRIDAGSTDDTETERRRSRATPQGEPGRLSSLVGRDWRLGGAPPGSGPVVRREPCAWV